MNPEDNPEEKAYYLTKIVRKITPSRPLLKVPMKKQVIDESGRLFEYEIENGKPVYSYLCSVMMKQAFITIE